MTLQDIYQTDIEELLHDLQAVEPEPGGRPFVPGLWSRWRFRRSET